MSDFLFPVLLFGFGLLALAVAVVLAICLGCALDALLKKAQMRQN